MEIKTTNEINEWFSKKLDEYSMSNENEDLNELNIRFGEVTNKKWIDSKDIIRDLEHLRCLTEDSVDSYAKKMINKIKSSHD